MWLYRYANFVEHNRNQEIFSILHLSNFLSRNLKCDDVWCKIYKAEFVIKNLE